MSFHTPRTERTPAASMERDLAPGTERAPAASTERGAGTDGHAPVAGTSHRGVRRSGREPRTSPPGVPRAGLDLPVGLFGIFALAAGLAFLLAGLLWPQAAEALLRLLLATLAVGFVLVRGHRAMRSVRATERSSSPFDRDVATRRPPAAPHVLRRLTADLSAADDARRARRTAIPRTVRWTVVDEASRRLAEHHGLSLDDPTHHPEIRSLVSEPTWSLIGPRDPRAGPGKRSAGRGGPVPLTQLDRILDDLEGL